MKLEVKTALGSARGRFLQGLPRRAAELQELADGLERAPSEQDLQGEAHRRLQSLHASAQVFQEQGMADAIASVIERVEVAMDSAVALKPNDIGAMRALAAELSQELEQARREASEPLSEAPPPPAAAPSPDRAVQLPAGRPSSFFEDEASQGVKSRKRTLLRAGGVAPGSRRVPGEDHISELFRPHPLIAARPADGSMVETPVALNQTVSGLLRAPRVVAVMVIGDPGLQGEVRAALPEERYELITSDDAATALDVVPNVAPDVVIIDGPLALGGETDVIARIRTTRGGSELSVLAVANGPEDVETLRDQAGADMVVQRPLSRERLSQRVERLVSGYGAPRTALEGLTEGTVGEIARSVADEIHRGIAQSLQSGHEAQIELGDKAELMAAAWSAIGRIRSHLADRSGGQVRFRDAPYAGGPAVLALTDDAPAAPYVGVGESLTDRRVLVADDDPAVLWFFAGLLRESGAVVLEAKNGKEALELARRRPPDVVISDILMPKVDGFALCRELKNDLLLSHVPVILLSWKEDFLERMRELSSGAAGYLRKEAGSHQIISTVANALRPRSELESLLSAGDEVRGRVERIGVLALLQTVARKRPDARVSIRDANNLFEIDVRGGSRLAVTRTAADGSFARGHVALRQLIGVSVGRFSVQHQSGPLRGAFSEPLDKLLLDGAKLLGGMLDAVGSRRLMRLHRVELDDEVLGSLLTATPTVLAEVVASLKAGDPPVRDLIAQGVFAVQDLEEQLRELVRRGAVVRVLGEGDVDLVAEALRERDEHPGVLMHISEPPTRLSSPPERPVGREVDWLDAEPETRPERPRNKTAVDPHPPFESGRAAGRSSSTQGASSKATPDGTVAVSFPRPRAETPIEPPPVLNPHEEGVPSQVAPDPGELEDELDELLGGSFETTTRPRRGTELGVAPPSPDPVSGEATGAALSSASEGGDSTTARLVDAREAVDAMHGVPARGRVVEEPIHELDAPKVSRAGGAWKLVLTLLMLTVVAFVAYREAFPNGAVERDPPAVPPSPVLAMPDPAEPEQADAPPVEQADEVEQEIGFGRVLPFIDRSRSVEVGEGEGLLVVEYESGSSPPEVQVGGKALGPAPAQIALPPGRHELVLRRGERSSFRYLVIRAGETRIVEVE